MDETCPEWPIMRLYELISGPAEYERPWNEIRALFLPGARLRMSAVEQDGTERLGDWSVDEFAELAANHYRQDGFWEREIARHTECFGNVGHVFSSYETRVGGPDGPPASRGINSVQVFRGDGSWRIAGVVFQAEHAGTEIPPRYLEPPAHAGN